MSRLGQKLCLRIQVIHTLSQMAAVVICLNDTFGVVSINVEGVQMGTNRLDGSEILVKFHTIRINYFGTKLLFGLT